MENSKKVWQKNSPLDAEVEQFTIGKDLQLDYLLARWDVIGSLAHSAMLRKVGLLDENIHQKLQNGLKQILRQIDSGSFRFEPGVEDIHSQVEILLTKMDAEAGARLHTGRSRNDQVLVDLRLFVRAEIKKIVEQVRTLFDLLIDLSEQYKDVLLPGYTHLQIAMPSSFGLWLAAFAESLVDDLIQLQAAYRLVNKNPLGSAAGYGSGFPLDRQMTARLLGFDDLNVNSVYAQMTRGKMERVVAQALGGIAETLSKLAMDLVLYQSQNFGFLKFPESITTGSSIMPHKKNPDVFEILRARCNHLKTLPVQIQMVINNLPSGYHRDFQITKEQFLPAFQELKECLTILIHVLPKMEVNRQILKDEAYRNLFTVEAVNDQVKKGAPFREAYRKVAEEVSKGLFKPPEKVHYSHEGSIGNLANAQIKRQMQSILKEFNFEKWQRALEKLTAD
ncbi:argininosuccinate lyase [Calditrichota bacterium LG25]